MKFTSSQLIDILHKQWNSETALDNSRITDELWNRFIEEDFDLFGNIQVWKYDLSPDCHKVMYNLCYKYLGYEKRKFNLGFVHALYFVFNVMLKKEVEVTEDIKYFCKGVSDYLKLCPKDNDDVVSIMNILHKFVVTNNISDVYISMDCSYSDFLGMYDSNKYLLRWYLSNSEFIKNDVFVKLLKFVVDKKDKGVSLFVEPVKMLLLLDKYDDLSYLYEPMFYLLRAFEEVSINDMKCHFNTGSISDMVENIEVWLKKFGYNDTEIAVCIRKILYMYTSPYTKEMLADKGFTVSECDKEEIRREYFERSYSLLGIELKDVYSLEEFIDINRIVHMSLNVEPFRKEQCEGNKQCKGIHLKDSEILKKSVKNIRIYDIYFRLKQINENLCTTVDVSCLYNGKSITSEIPEVVFSEMINSDELWKVYKSGFFLSYFDNKSKIYQRVFECCADKLVFETVSDIRLFLDGFNNRYMYTPYKSKIMSKIIGECKEVQEDFYELFGDKIEEYSEIWFDTLYILYAKKGTQKSRVGLIKL